MLCYSSSHPKTLLVLSLLAPQQDQGTDLTVPASFRFLQQASCSSFAMELEVCPKLPPLFTSSTHQDTFVLLWNQVSVCKNILEHGVLENQIYSCEEWICVSVLERFPGMCAVLGCILTTTKIQTKGPTGERVC